MTSWCSYCREGIAASAALRASSEGGNVRLGMATTLIPPGGAVVVEIPRRELDYYASRLLSVGTDHVVELPPQMAEAVRAGDNDTEQHSPKVKFRAWLTEAGVEQVEEVRA